MIIVNWLSFIKIKNRNLKERKRKKNVCPKMMFEFHEFNSSMFLSWHLHLRQGLEVCNATSHFAGFSERGGLGEGWILARHPPQSCTIFITIIVILSWRNCQQLSITHTVSVCFSFHPVLVASILSLNGQRFGR